MQSSGNYKPTSPGRRFMSGHEFTGLRIYLELPATVNGVQHQGPFIHRPGDDDSSAVTFWGKQDLRVVLRQALARLDLHYAQRDCERAQTARSAAYDRLHGHRDGVLSQGGAAVGLATAATAADAHSRKA